MIHYDKPRIGWFYIHTDEYRLPGGWVNKKEPRMIIGETDDLYVVRLQQGEHDERTNGQIITRRYMVPVGVHKSRFIEWV